MNFASTNLLFLLFLFLHIGASIVAFGPTFAMPIIGAMGGAEPRYANFTARIMLALEKRLIAPLAILVGLTGLGLIWTSGRDVMRDTWLLVAIVLYVIALTLALAVSAPTGRRLVEATSTPPPAHDPSQSVPDGPPPHIAALVKRAQTVGMTLSVLLVAILLLMVFKPRF